MYRIVIGDKAYSSWSLRGWLMLAAFDLPFEEELVRMYDPGFAAMLAARAPARTVPILEWQEGGATRRVWDTMAIAETLAERHPQAGHWPSDPAHRAVARVVTATMHAGFAALRGAAPMNIHRGGRPLVAVPEAVAADLAALDRLWGWAWEQTGGPWLGGARFGAADAMFAPVALRLTGYGLGSAVARGFADRLIAHPAVAAWIVAAEADPRRIAEYDLP